MIRLSILRFFAVSSLWLGAAPFARALTITMDYSYDLLSNGGTGFFQNTPMAVNAVNAAAADISAAILPSLSAISTDVFTGTNGGATVTFDWSLSFTNPSTGATVSLATFNLPTDTLTIYAGMQSLAASTLGQGGPAGGALGLGASGTVADRPGAVTAAVNNSNAVMVRNSNDGSGPIMGSITGTFAGQSFAANYGPLAGNLWFDNDTNNNGAVDDAATLAAAWHYDPTTAVAAGKSDFYSVALHEILHAVGVGTSTTWTGLKSGTTWNGANVIALTGSGAGMISTNGDHIAEGKMSVTLAGVTQEAVMDPTITIGTRKVLTRLDLAFLQDLGYNVVPEPSAVVLLGMGVAGAGFGRLRRRVA